MAAFRAPLISTVRSALESGRITRICCGGGRAECPLVRAYSARRRAMPCPRAVTAWISSVSCTGSRPRVTRTSIFCVPVPSGPSIVIPAPSPRTRMRAGRGGGCQPSNGSRRNCGTGDGIAGITRFWRGMRRRPSSSRSSAASSDRSPDVRSASMRSARSRSTSFVRWVTTTSNVGASIRTRRVESQSTTAGPPRRGAGIRASRRTATISRSARGSCGCS